MNLSMDLSMDLSMSFSPFFLSCQVERLKGEVTALEERLEHLTSTYAGVAKQQIEVGEQLKEYIVELEQSMDRKVERHAMAAQECKSFPYFLIVILNPFSPLVQAERETLLGKLEERGQQVQKEAKANLEAQAMTRDVALKVEKLEGEKTTAITTATQLGARLKAEMQAHQQTQATLEELRKIQEDHERSSQSFNEQAVHRMEENPPPRLFCV